MGNDMALSNLSFPRVGAIGSASAKFSGPAPMIIKDRITREVDPREWNGFDLSGNNANDSIIRDALTQAMQSGLPFRSVSGICAMDTGVSLTLNKDLEIDLPLNFIFKHTPNLGAPAITLNCAQRDTFGFKLRGGRFDTSTGKFVQNQQSNTGIGFVRLRRFTIDGTYFLGAASLDAAITSTDSGITWVDCRDGSVINCVFDGMGDCGIYGSGNNDNATSDDDGDEVSILNNRFRRCFAAVNMKRQATRTKFIGNGVYDCDQGYCAWEVSPVGPGRQNIVLGNTFKKIRHSAVNLHTALGGIVSSNIIDDFGCLSDGVTASDLPHAIRLLGTEGVVCRDNEIFCTEWTPTTSHQAYAISNNNYNSTIFPSVNNIIEGGIVRNINTGVAEGTTQVGPNRFTNIQMIGVTNPYVNTSATGSLIEAPSGNGKLIGKSTTSVAVAGVQIAKDGAVVAARAGTVSTWNLLSTNGPFASYQVNGTTVGQASYTVPGTGNPNLGFGPTGSANIDGRLGATGNGKSILDGPVSFPTKTLTELATFKDPNYANAYVNCSNPAAGKSRLVWYNSGTTSWIYVADGSTAA